MRGFLRCARALRTRGIARIAQNHRLCYSSLAALQEPEKDLHAVFQKKMEIAGVDPRDRIGISVARGAVEEMALCLLAREWKRSIAEKEGRIDGLIGIVYKRPNPDPEKLQELVATIEGMQCEVLNWPKECSQFDVLDAGCLEKDIDFVLLPRHADDLVIDRLRHAEGQSSPLSALSNLYLPETRVTKRYKSMLVVRPLLDIFRSELVEFCERAGQRWIENSLKKGSELLTTLSDSQSAEVSEILEKNRKLRAEQDAEINSLIAKYLHVNTEYGYVVIDVHDELLEGTGEDTGMKVLQAALRFVSQGRLPRTLTILRALNWLKRRPTEGERTWRNCALYIQPDTNGSKVLATCYCAPFEPRKPRKKKENAEDEKSPDEEELPQKDIDVVSECTARVLAEAVEEASGTISPESIFEKEEKLLKLQHGVSTYFMERFLISCWQEEPTKCKDSCLLKDVQRARVRRFKESDLDEIKKLVQLDPNSALCATDSSVGEAHEKLCSLPSIVRCGLPILTTEDHKIIGVPSVGLQICPSTRMKIKFRPRIPLSSDNTIWD